MDLVASDKFIIISALPRPSWDSSIVMSTAVMTNNSFYDFGELLLKVSLNMKCYHVFGPKPPEKIITCSLLKANNIS